MKRFSALLLAALLCATLILPLRSLASSDYELAYDATDAMDSEFMDTLGSETYYELTELLGAEVRTDIVTDLEGRTIVEYAQAYYDAYDYGYGDSRACILLMIQCHEDDTGLAYDNYYVLETGGAEDLFTDQQRQALNASLDAFLNPAMWQDDLAFDVVACESALSSFAQVLAGLGGSDSVTIPAVAAEDALLGTEGTETEEAETPSLISTLDSAQGTYVLDLAGLLSEDERANLEELAAEASEKYDSGVYVVTVNDYLDYNTSPYEAAKTIYSDYGLGLGPDQSGTLLMLSMADRDYAYIARGEFGNYAFTDYGKAQLEDEFLDNFRNDDWYGGFQDFINESDYYMSQADAGTPIDVPVKEPVPTGTAVAGSVGVGAVASCAGAAIRCNGLKKKMKSVKTKADATQYMASGVAGIAGGLVLRASNDQFLNTTVTRVPIHVNDDHDRGGWSGGTTIDSGGFSGHSGKF